LRNGSERTLAGVVAELLAVERVGLQAELFARVARKII
jgi:hypothetical protein